MLLYFTLLFKRAVPTFCLFFHISIIFQYPNPDFGNIGILNIDPIFNISICHLTLQTSGSYILSVFQYFNIPIPTGKLEY